jgi:RNA polymerase sigma-70 factor (ECF subfamily)
MAAVSPLGRASGVERRDAPADALTGLYERHASRVFQYCLNWLRSREEAEDAAQTTFLYAYRALDRDVVPTHERGWLLSIARNVCLSRTDANRRRAVEVAQDPHALEEILAAPAQSTELEGLTDALAALTEQQRHAILLREWHGLTYSEIADRLELSQAAVETLLFRARRSLARRLRQPLGIGSFLPWLRSLAEGGAAKITVGAAAAVAVTATTGAIAVAHQHQPRHTTPTPAIQGATVTRSPAAPRQISQPKRRVAASQATAKDNAQKPVASHPDGTVTSTPAATPPAVEPNTPANTITNAVTTTTATTTAAANVVDTATTAVGTVVDTATATAATAVTTVQTVIATVTNAVPTVTLPPLLPLP